MIGPNSPENRENQKAIGMIRTVLFETVFGRLKKESAFRCPKIVLEEIFFIRSFRTAFGLTL